ncbi:GNAT family N-acetyltransferase [Oceanobacillus kimchii]|uniref:GNAT family N-acetyltransferase n=1 Tax=Oceanobacillus kimchii TaxID=746691 RepID=UPI003C71EF31
MTLASKIIETERLTLRPFTLEDAEDVTNLCDNYNIYKTTLHIPYPYTLENAKEWISSHEINRKEDTLYQFAITDKDSGELYGSISLSNRKNHQNGEIAYWLGEEFWGRGFVTEASKAMIQFALKRLFKKSGENDTSNFFVSLLFHSSRINCIRSGTQSYAASIFSILSILLFEHVLCGKEFPSRICIPS